MSASRTTVPALAAVIAMSLAHSAAAQSVRKGDLTISTHQMRGSIGRARNTAGYLTIRNSGKEPDRLFYVACTCAERVEMHTTQMAGGVGAMVKLPSITIPPGGQVTLAPGGTHLMFIGLKSRLATGKDQRVTLTFTRAGAVRVDFPVRARIETKAAGAHHGH